MSFLRRDGGLKLLAIIVAVVLWSYVRVVENPFREVKYTQLQMRVPLEIEGRGPDVLVESPAEEVSVTLRGDRRDMEKVRTELISATVDVSDLSPGVYRLPVKVLPPGPVELVEQDPALVTLELAPRLTRTVPVEIRVVGSPAVGTRVAGPPASDPSSVKITGPQRQVERVQRVVAKFLLQGDSTNVSQRVRELDPVDEADQIVPRVEVAAAHVVAAVEIQPEDSAVFVQVRPDNIDVQTPPGLEPRVTIEPRFVEVLPSKGVPAPGRVLTIPIDFGTLTSGVTRTVALEVPTGVELLGQPSVQVRVEVTRRKVSATPSPSPSHTESASPSRNSPSPPPGT
ncbi:MAG: CdaR family protein [Candidatus Eremiobacterota bacterium]